MNIRVRQYREQDLKEIISGKNLCWTVWNREQDISLKFCSLMRWLRPMSMQDTCMKDWDLSSLG